MNTEVNNTVNEAKASFEKAYGMLPAIHQAKFRKDLMKECRWSHMTFHNKKNGETSFSPIEKRAVEEAFEAFSLDAWTGEYIKPLTEA